MKLPQPIDQLHIVMYPAPVLRQCCEPVEAFDDQLTALANRMEQLRHDVSGVGLAAPQVAVPIRMFICNPSGQPGDTTVWVNPVLSDLEGSVEAEEGCLSLPGVSVPKRRARRAVIDGYDLTGKPIRAEGTELSVRIWQHETDHLNGVLVTDGMHDAAELVNRRALRQLETHYAAASMRRAASAKR